MTSSIHSMRLRLALFTALVAAVIGCAISVVASSILQSGLETELRSFAVHEAEELGSVVAAFSTGEELLRERERLEPFTKESGLLSFGVYSWEGTPLLGYRGEEPWMPEGWPEGLESAKRGDTPFEAIEGQAGPAALRTAIVVQAPAGTRWILSTTVTHLGAESAASRFTLLYWAGLLVAVLLSFLGAYLLVGNALRPVNAMVTDARAFATEDPSRRLVVPPAGSELAELAKLINSMLDRTEQTITQLRRFASNAGHELRTPLTRIRGDAETALRTTDSDRQSEALASVLEEIDELRDLLDALLEFARGEDPRLLIEPLLRFDELVLELGEETRELAGMQDIQVSVKVESTPVFVHGNRLLLSRAIWNLVSNALKFTPAGGSLEFRLSADEDWARLELSDTGAGLGPGDRDLLFEPFYKREGPRRDPSGHGLGLPLSRAIARRHGGDLRASDSPGVGSTFEMILPRGTSDGSVELSPSPRHQGIAIDTT